MGLIEHYKYERENKSVKEAIKSTLQKGFDKLIGIKEYKELNETLYYFLNAYADITQAPPAKGSLRNLQLCDVELMRIFDKICEKYQLVYWMDYGTLLGAVRHKGFIPWDDDLDVAMPRKDYMKLRSVLKKELGEYDFAYEGTDIMCRIGYGYKHSETGIKIDVFPVDHCTMNGCIKDVESILERRILKYRKQYLRKRKHTPMWKMDALKEQMINVDKNGRYHIIYHGPEFMYPRVVMHDRSDIFPLQKIEFEGAEFAAPANLDAYLKRIYGEHYMDFPNSGVEHHLYGGVKMADFAIKSGIDMTEIKEFLSTLAEREGGGKFRKCAEKNGLKGDDTAYWNAYYKGKPDIEYPSQFALEIGNQLKKPGTILDLGCGNGRDSIYFYKLGLRVTAIDASDTAIQMLQEQYDEEQIHFRCDDFVKSSEIYRSKYDYCYSRFSLHAIDESQEDELIANVYQALNPEGKFFVEVRSIHDELYGKGEAAGRNAYIFDGHFRRFIKREELEKKMLAAGFKIEYSNEQQGFAPFGETDPPIIRMILQK